MSTLNLRLGRNIMSLVCKESAVSLNAASSSSPLRDDIRQLPKAKLQGDVTGFPIHAFHSTINTHF